MDPVVGQDRPGVVELVGEGHGEMPEGGGPATTVTLALPQQNKPARRQRPRRPRSAAGARRGATESASLRLLLPPLEHFPTRPPVSQRQRDLPEQSLPSVGQEHPRRRLEQGLRRRVDPFVVHVHGARGQLDTTLVGHPDHGGVHPEQLELSFPNADGIITITAPAGALPVGATILLAVVFWAFATWLIPVLVAAGWWRHVRRRVPLRYEATLWSIIFPLGMYAVAGIYLGQANSLPVVGMVGRIELWVAFAAWSFEADCPIACVPPPA